jgi:hypothetical protein
MKCPYRIDTYYIRDNVNTEEHFAVAKEYATRSVQEFGECYQVKCPYYQSTSLYNGYECKRVKEGTHNGNRA